MKTISKVFWSLLILMLAGCTAELTDYDLSGPASLSPDAARWGGSAVPRPPILSSPINGAVEIPLVPYPVLTWKASSGAASYSVQISDSSTFGNLLAYYQGLTGYAVVAYIPLKSAATYFWRANASNSRGTSGWSAASRFTTTTITVPEGIPIPVSPANGAENVSLNPTLTWLPIEGDATYEVQVASHISFQTTHFHWTGISGTSITINDESLIEASASQYYWRVRARNIAGAGPWSAVSTFKTVRAF
jgi:hypothetical protein